MISGKYIDPFNFIDKIPLESLHLGYCKHVLGVNKNSSNFGVRTELGRLPIDCHIKVQSLIYLARLYTSDINPLLEESFQLSESLDASGVYTWVSYAKDILSESEIDIERLKACRDQKSLNNIKKYIKCQMHTYYSKLFENKLNSIDEKSKLFFYKKLNIKFLTKPYLSISNFEFRRLITKLRISDHVLLIEKGRHFKIPREERLCQKCKLLDDEIHFLLHCTINSNLRKEYFEFLSYDSFFKDLSISEKIIYILNPSTPTEVNKLGSFIKKSIELRTGEP